MDENKKWKLKKQYCKIHFDEFYNSICVQTECQSKGLICVECSLQKHQNHQRITLEQFQECLVYQSEANKPILIITALIDIQHAKAKQLCENIADQYLKQFMKKRISNYFYKKVQIILDYKQRKESITKSVGANDSEAIRQFCTDYKISHVSRKGVSKELQQQSNLQCMLEQMTNQTQQFHKLCNTKQKNYNSLYSFNQYQTNKFSQVEKHESIRVQRNRQTAMQENNFETNIVLVMPPILRQAKIINKTIKLRINNPSSWLSIGVVYLDFAKKMKFHLDMGSNGHGGYLISYNGYAWHHSHSEIHSKYIGFQFGESDVIVLRANIQRKRLKYQIQGKELTYELPIDILEENQLYFCVCLSAHRQSVSILQ